jgi:hypothetical protein
MDTDLELEHAVAVLRSSRIDTPPVADILRRHRVTRVVATLVALVVTSVGGVAVAHGHLPRRDQSVSAGRHAVTPELTLGTDQGVWPVAGDRPFSIEELASRFAVEVLGWRSYQTSFSPNSTFLGPTFVTVQRLDVGIRFLAAPLADHHWTIVQVGDGLGTYHGDGDANIVWDPTAPAGAVSAHWYAAPANGPTIEGDTADVTRVLIPLGKGALVSSLVLYYDHLGQLIGAAGMSGGN